MSRKAQKTFVITNNHPNGQAAVNALELKQMLSGVRPKALRNYSAHIPNWPLSSSPKCPFLVRRRMLEKFDRIFLDPGNA
jgi:hypothetical protein